MKQFERKNVKKSATLKCLLCIFLLVSITILILSNFNIQTSIENNDYFEECTSVIVTGTAAKDSRAILMKNRDASDTMNKPIYYPPKDGKYGYVMVNWVWMGINEKGLAVMNTAVSALAFGGSGLDNGALNRWIIEHCETVEEVCFELNNTDSTIGPGKRQGGTCIGVIDRFGKGAFIEISGIGAYARFIVNGYDSQANHPRCYPGYASGPSGRDQYALDIMNAIYAEKDFISWEDVAQNVSRYVRNKEKGTSNFSISGEISNTITQAAMVAVSGDPRYDGKLGCMWGEYGNPPMVGLFIPSMPYAGQPPPILNSFWNYVWQKRTYAQDSYGYYVPSKVREIQDYTFFAEDITFWKYDELIASITDGLPESELKARLQEYVNQTVQTATQLYIAEPQVLHHAVTYNGNNYKITTVSNSTISDFNCSTNLYSSAEISFNVTSTLPDSSGFCYIMIPTELVNGSLAINVNNEEYVIEDPPQYENNTLLNFTYNHPSQIRIASLPPPDLEPPNIGTPIRDPTGIVEPYQAVKISVNITDVDTGVKNATLLYSTDNGTSWTITEMTPDPETSYYEVVIPGQPPDTWVRFIIIAYDLAENQAIKDDVDPYHVNQVIPEFSSAPMLLLLMIASVSFALTCQRKSFRL
jgi:hypothetical protein